jgi:rod shape-determining protein MreD
MNREFSVHLPLRIALVAFLAVVIQETTVSQISIFGVTADITPIVVMSIGLLCGSLPGAIAGFAIGLFVDLALVQTLGVTSLLYIAVGYWSGRLRETRDPSHGLIPMLLAAIATGFTGVGMAVIQFMLGVTAPVSFLLIEQIILQMLVNTLIALPVYETVRRWLHPALPGDPRRRRRTYTSGAMSPLQRPSERIARASRSAQR